jgi:predicted MPP superfamily phosphohydrolase
MHRSKFWWLIVTVLLLIDFYFFQGLRLVAVDMTTGTRQAVFTGYWTLSLLAITGLIILPYLHFQKQAKLGKAKVFTMIAGLFFAKFLGSLVFLFDDIRRGLVFIAGDHSSAIPRSFVFSTVGLVAAASLFLLLIYGFRNKYRYRLTRVNLNYDNLPEAFKGLKVVHISDIHSGSFTNKEAVQKGVRKIMEQAPDLILFTGDLVNNVADEMHEYMDVFNQLSAPLGVYSTLGNHDYGDYVKWESMDKKHANLEKLKQVHADLGWRLLMNEHVVLEREGHKIAVIGIENWSAKARFPSYGNLQKAYAGAEVYPFKILMSHDPSHWKAEVVESYTDIDLTLAGHTHGMQFGFEIPWLKWSPVKYVYKEWAGLYEHRREGKQNLYINRGFGFIGYPGRVGILPEITLLELN